jgi:HK97 family phage portal protein
VQDTQAGRRVWSEADVLHITGLSSDGLIGESVISRCRNTLGTAMARDEFEGEFYKVGGTSRGIVQHPGRLKAEGIENLRKGLDAVLGGSKNTGRSGVLEEGATWQSISMPLADMEFVASQHLTRTDVALMFKLPPAYLGGSTGDSLTYSTVESNQIQFAQNAIAPWANTIAKALASDPGIFPYSAWYPEFMLEGLMRGDHGARAGFYEKMFNLVDGEGRRALTVDEIRARESLPPAEKEPQPIPPRLRPRAANGNGNGNGGLTAADLAAMARGAVS